MDTRRDFRTIKARGKVLTERQMRDYRIKGIYNATGEVEAMTDAYMQDFAIRCYRPEYGEIAVIETSLKDSGRGNPLQVVSVLVFADSASWHMYALKNPDTYLQKGHSLFTLVN